jgi:hypothetical protein
MIPAAEIQVPAQFCLRGPVPVKIHDQLDALKYRLGYFHHGRSSEMGPCVAVEATREQVQTQIDHYCDTMQGWAEQEAEEVDHGVH